MLKCDGPLLFDAIFRKAPANLRHLNCVLLTSVKILSLSGADDLGNAG